MENTINELNELAPLYDEFFIIDEPLKNNPKENEKINKTVTFLGGYQSGFLMLHEGSPSFNDKDKEMLHNLIVNAIKIKWDDVAVINITENAEWTFDKVISELKPKKILCWGCETYLDNQNINQNKYVVADINQTQLLCTDAIAFYHDKPDMKRKLWTGIQELLGLS